ncbi:lytic murein transglycosylase B [uncultured Umboniibacter sp.]|uniref:lytic murein transglycosylase B n=1 Tax=uncultured Umboniibacter sp. TaxID=1798917 RepID=UPI00260339AF|nr:lytic murein transglycosylase B [uncultured Umboniibacter sp.]
MRKILRGLVTASLLASSSLVAYERDGELVEAWIAEVSSEHGIDAEYLRSLMAEASYKQSIIDAISRPAERVLTWEEYRNIFIEQARIDGGIEFIERNLETLKRIEAETGVSAEYIVAIIGVETRYGRIMGNYRVIDALSTLGFSYPRRSSFFKKELTEFVLMIEETGLDPLSLKGSYAGAMGLGQFIPSSYRAYSKDDTGDGVADLWESEQDAIASVANYFKRHGWKAGEPVLVNLAAPEGAEEFPRSPLRLDRTMAEVEALGYRPDAALAADTKARIFYFADNPDGEYIAGLQNFYTITRYNHSSYYALAVHQLAEVLREQSILSSQ